MKENMALLIAFRRNNRKRGFQLFADEFSRATGLPLTDADLVDAEKSIHLERLLESKSPEIINNGSLIRKSELIWKQVQTRLVNYSLKIENSRLLLFMCHYPDFAFWIPVADFVAHAKSILDFDGDTVYAISEDLQCGVGIDEYTSELTAEIRYTIDLWP